MRTMRVQYTRIILQYVYLARVYAAHYMLVSSVCTYSEFLNVEFAYNYNASAAYTYKPSVYTYIVTEHNNVLQLGLQIKSF